MLFAPAHSELARDLAVQIHQLTHAEADCTDCTAAALHVVGELAYHGKNVVQHRISATLRRGGTLTPHHDLAGISPEVYSAGSNLGASHVDADDVVHDPRYDGATPNTAFTGRLPML